MGILLTLAVVNLNSTQVRARDDERRADVAAIASAFENFYQRGTIDADPGTYPSTVTSDGTNQDVLDKVDGEMNIQSLLAPGIDNASVKSLISATNNVQIASGVTPQPNTTNYIYQPLQADGSLCTSDLQECRKFNIFYQLETDSSIEKITSRSQ
jgi:Tfp pilus assembly protein PilE